jgi:hypothetical protein
MAWWQIALGCVLYLLVAVLWGVVCKCKDWDIYPKDPWPCATTTSEFMALMFWPVTSVGWILYFVLGCAFSAIEDAVETIMEGIDYLGSKCRERKWAKWRILKYGPSSAMDDYNNGRIGVDELQRRRDQKVHANRPTVRK